MTSTEEVYQEGRTYAAKLNYTKQSRFLKILIAHASDEAIITTIKEYKEENKDEVEPVGVPKD